MQKQSVVQYPEELAEISNMQKNMNGQLVQILYYVKVVLSRPWGTSSPSVKGGNINSIHL